MVKLARAESGRIEHDNVMLEDSMGSAKLALTGVGRSTAAWETIRKYFPEQAEQVFDILLELDRLRRSVEQEIPDARAFQRPYFDN